MKHRKDLLLQFGPQVNQDVAATDQIHLGKRRIVAQVLPGEDTHVPDPLGDLITFIRLAEEAAEPFG